MADSKKKSGRSKVTPTRKRKTTPKKPTRKIKVGRPKQTVKERVEQIHFDFDKIRKLVEIGLVDEEICLSMGINKITLNRWKKEDPEFMYLLKKGKEVANNRVVRSLYERCIGYSHPDVYISNYQGMITETKITKHYPPDPTSCIFWLSNRDPDSWKRNRIEDDGLGDEYIPALKQLLLKQIAMNL